MLLILLQFVVSCISFLLYFFLSNVALNLHTHFHLVYCIFAVVIVCHFLCSLMAPDCQDIKGLLTYLLNYNWPACVRGEIEIEQGLTSHQTHYRSYRGRFLQVI